MTKAIIGGLLFVAILLVGWFPATAGESALTPISVPLQATATATATVSLTPTFTPTATATPTATVTPVPGTYKVTAAAFIDARCDGVFEPGEDIRLSGVDVTFDVGAGTTHVRQTNDMGWVHLYGFDGSEGVTVSVEASEYHGRSLGSCENSRLSYELDAEDFDGANVLHRTLWFRFQVLGELAGP